MIRLSSAKIENYKGIRNLEIEFNTGADGCVHPVIGLNEAGKTTVLEALTFIAATNEDMSALGFTGLKKTLDHELIPISMKSNFSGDVCVTLGFVCDPEDAEEIKRRFNDESNYELSYFPLKFGLNRSITFTDSLITDTDSHYVDLDPHYQKGAKRLKRPNDVELWPILRKIIASKLPTLLYVPNFLFDIPQEIPLLPSNELDPKHAFFHRLLDGILKAEDESLSFETHIVQRASSEESSIASACSATVTKLQYALQNRVLGQWAQVFGSSLGDLRVKLNIRTAAAAPHLEITIQQEAGEYRLSDRSLGFRWFFAFLMLTFFRKPGSGRQTVFLLDEPASNLHAGAQARLLSCFGSMKDSLFIYATHSHYLLSADLLPLTFVTRNLGYDQHREEAYVASNTNIEVLQYRHFVSKYPSQTDHFRVALDVLDVPISSLTLKFPAVFVEGKGDYYCLRLAKLSGLWPSDETHYPCGGVNTMDSKVFDAICQSQQFAVLTDADEAGTGILTKLIARYGIVLEERAVSLATVDKKLAGSEFWYSEADRRQIIHSAGMKGTSKSAFHRAVELLVSTRRPIVPHDDTVATFEKIRKAILEKL